MNEEVVILRAGTTTPVVLPATMGVTFNWHSWAALGGPEEMEATVTGPSEAIWEVLRWLGYGVEVRNERGSTIWWGFVDDVTVRLGPGLEIGLSLEEMYNRVQVAYTYEDAAGDLQDAETAWAQDDASVDRYGTKELRHTQADTTATAADALRDRIVTQKGVPRGVPSVGGEGEVSATVRGRGWYSTLGWKYYEQLAGKEGHEITGGESQSLGVGRTSSIIGFRDDPRRLFDSGTGFLAGSKFVVSGSSSNNGTYEVASITEQDDVDITSSTIYFETQDDIWCAGTLFSSLAIGDVIQVEGSSLNDGIFEIQSLENDNHIEVREKGINAEAAGSSITIRRRSYLTTVEQFVTENAGSSITLTGYGIKVGQQFTLSHNASWTVAEVAIRVRKVGSPADSLKIELCDESSLQPGTVLDSGTLAASEITTGMDWQVVELSNTQALSFGTNYWVVVSRTGSNDAENYYVIDMDEDTGYGGGYMWLYTGSAWTARDPQADMPFVVWGKEQTTTQLEDMATDAGQFVDAVELIDTSGITTRQYRSGENLARDEMEELLQIGASDGSRMLALVNREQRLLIYKQPVAAANTDWQVRNDGRLVSALGEPIDPGRTPAGRWVHLAEIPGQVDAVAQISPFFVERATYYADGRLTLEPEGAPSPWDVPGIRQG